MTDNILGIIGTLAFILIGIIFIYWLSLIHWSIAVVGACVETIIGITIYFDNV